MSDEERDTRSRSRWRSALAWTAGGVVTIHAVGRGAGAQTLATIHEISVAASGASCAALPTLQSRAQLEAPFGTLLADAAAGAGEGGPPAFRGSAEAAVRAPEWRGWRLYSSAQWSSSDAVACGLQGRDRGANVEASYRHGTGGVWLGYRWRSLDPALHPPMPAGFSLGAWRSLGAVVMSVSLGTHPDTGTRTSFASREVVRVDTVFNDTLQRWETVQYNTTVVDTTVDRWRSSVLESRARVAWSHGRWSADATVGVLWGRQGVAPAPWGTLEASMEWTPRVAVVGGFVAAPRRGLVLDPGRRVGTLGFRVIPAPVAPRRPAPEPPPPRRFEARPGQGGELVLAVSAPHARYVELAGDFTTWEARRMRRAPGGWWELPVRLGAGRYQVNIRVDGARWMPPPGLPSVRDEFGGTVGILVVP